MRSVTELFIFFSFVATSGVTSAYELHRKCSSWNDKPFPIGHEEFYCPDGYQAGTRVCEKSKFDYDSGRWMSEGSAEEKGCFVSASGRGYCVEGCAP